MSRRYCTKVFYSTILDSSCDSKPELILDLVNDYTVYVGLLFWNNPQLSHYFK
jgi:hypothetical protein